MGRKSEWWNDEVKHTEQRRVLKVNIRKFMKKIRRGKRYMLRERRMHMIKSWKEDESGCSRNKKLYWKKPGHTEE